MVHPSLMDLWGVARVVQLLSGCRGRGRLWKHRDSVSRMSLGWGALPAVRGPGQGRIRVVYGVWDRLRVEGRVEVAPVCLR